MAKHHLLLPAALAITVCAAAVIGFWTWPVLPNVQSIGEAYHLPSPYLPGRRGCRPEVLDAIAAPAKRVEAYDACEKDAEQYRLSTGDLAQQRRAADAALVQAKVANQQLRMGWLQTLGGLLTLAAAIGAAIYAREAARHTRNANEIALNAQRAWIVLSLDPKLASPDYEGGLYFRTELIMENVGHTAAMRFSPRADMLFQGPGESVDDLIQRMYAKVIEWHDLNRTPIESALPAGAIDRGPFWTNASSSELITETIFDTVEISHPIVLVAVFYRTVTRPEVDQISWRAWRINSVEDDGHPVSFLRLGKSLDAAKLGLSPVFGLRHEERPAVPVDAATIWKQRVALCKFQGICPLN